MKKKKTEIEIDDDLLRQAEGAAEERGMELCGFVEDAIRERLSKHQYWKAKRYARLKDTEIQERKRRVEEYWGNISLDRETIETILKEDSYLDA